MPIYFHSFIWSKKRVVRWKPILDNQYRMRNCFISLFIGSHIVESTEIVHPENRKRAIIVCPNGISIAVLLENTLKNLLPEIDFIMSMSAREFYRKDYDVDFIFSAVPLKTEKKVFVVNNFLSEQENAN